MLVSQRDIRQYPAPNVDKDCLLGIIPVDFILEQFLEKGLKWFRETPTAPGDVFGFLKTDILQDKYGQAKIDEIAKYFIDTEIDVKQSFPVEDEEIPSISINLQSSVENGTYTGLNDAAGFIQALGSDGVATQTTERGYTPIKDDILIGIHTSGSPDKSKYLYYLVIYILNAFRDQLESPVDTVNGLFNLSWRATDLSRMNEYLPTHVFSRFVTVSVEHFSLYNKETIPSIGNIDVIVNVDDGV